MKILIAEDDSVTLALIRHQLEKDNYTISAYTDARDALQSLETFKPDLIITDIVMPFTSGLELISIIRSSGIKTPILVLSAFDEEETVLEALSLGANDFITKPFNNAELSMRVKRLLNVKRK
ncbi:MAG TPA: response regulator [Chitinophagaceae bacterium]